MFARVLVVIVWHGVGTVTALSYITDGVVESLARLHVADVTVVGNHDFACNVYILLTATARGTGIALSFGPPNRGDLLRTEFC